MLDLVTDCEHEVEVARARLKKDLNTLRSPSTFRAFNEQLKSEVIVAKDAVVMQAREAVQASLAGFIEDVKAKAAANPAAVVAIGAGIAWRLFRRPPIAAILVGAGAFNLWRTPISRKGARDNKDYLDEGKQRLKEQVNELGADVSVIAADVGRMVAEKAERAYGSAKEQMQGWSHDAAESVAEVASTAKTEADRVILSARHTLQSSGDQATSLATRALTGSKALAREIATAETFTAANARDTVLLGVAGLAVAGALGIAYQKRGRPDIP